MEPDLIESDESATDQVCADCGSKIHLTEEVWLLQVVQLQVIGGETKFYPILNEQDPNKGFLFEPYFFCFNCWESQSEDLKEEIEDSPPIEDLGCVADCFYCGSSIREGEYSGHLTIGEFHTSNRAPSGLKSARFYTEHAPETMCLYCLALLNSSFIEMWDELSQFGECMDCMFTRCWRGPSCPCTCHVPEQEETEQRNE